MTWLTPSQLDLEHWRWLRMKPQRGGWVQSLWIVLQEQWRQAVTCTRCNGEKPHDPEKGCLPGMSR